MLGGGWHRRATIARTRVCRNASLPAPAWSRWPRLPFGKALREHAPRGLGLVGQFAHERYMGEDRAAEFGARNGVPGELLIRLTPARIIAQRAVSG
jgi:hypothetical protein